MASKWPEIIKTSVLIAVKMKVVTPLEVNEKRKSLAELIKPLGNQYAKNLIKIQRGKKRYTAIDQISRIF